MSRALRREVTDEAEVLIRNGHSASTSDDRSRSYLLAPQGVTEGVIHLGPPESGALTTSNSFRWDLAIIAERIVELEPGEELEAMVETDTIAVDVMELGR